MEHIQLSDILGSQPMADVRLDSLSLSADSVVRTFNRLYEELSGGGGGGAITCDQHVDYTLQSKNPVENRAIANELAQKLDMVTLTSDSTNVGELWGGVIGQKDGVIASAVENGSYIVSFNIADRKIKKAPLETSSFRSTRSPALCYSESARMYVYVEADNRKVEDIYAVIWTSYDTCQWKQMYNKKMEYYEDDKVAASAKVLNVIYDPDT